MVFSFWERFRSGSRHGFSGAATSCWAQEPPRKENYFVRNSHHMPPHARILPGVSALLRQFSTERAIPKPGMLVTELSDPKLARVPRSATNAARCRTRGRRRRGQVRVGASGPPAESSTEVGRFRPAGIRMGSHPPALQHQEFTSIRVCWRYRASYHPDVMRCVVRKQHVPASQAPAGRAAGQLLRRPACHVFRCGQTFRLTKACLLRFLQTIQRA